MYMRLNPIYRLKKSLYINTTTPKEEVKIPFRADIDNMYESISLL